MNATSVPEYKHQTCNLFDNNENEMSTALPALREPDVDNYWQYKLHNQLFMYVSPVLIFGGTLGNILSLLVVQSKVYRSSPPSFILSALALADTGMLNTGLLRQWIRMLTDYEHDIRESSDGACKTHLYFTYLFAHLSPWYIVLLTLERTVCVFLPLKCKEVFSQKRIIIVLVIITVLLLLVNAHFFFTVKLHAKSFQTQNNKTQTFFQCSSIDSFSHGTWYWVDSSLSTLLPLLTIFTGNVAITIKLILYQKKASHSLGLHNNEMRNARPITAMLFVISAAFLILTLPASIYFLGRGSNTWPRNDNQDSAKLLLAYAVVVLLRYTNHAIYFILYCLSGSKFRQAFLDVVCFYYKSSSPIEGTTPRTSPMTNVEGISRI